MKAKSVELQVALDTLSLDLAVESATRLHDIVDRIEVGTPLIYSAGMDAVTKLRTVCGKTVLVADTKIMDGGYRSAKMAFEAGADIVTVLGAASRFTIKDVIRAARECKGQVMVDLINVSDIDSGAREARELGAEYILLHIAVDDKGRSWSQHNWAGDAGGLQIAVAGGINESNLAEVVKLSPDIVIVGSAISGAADPLTAAVALKSAVDRLAHEEKSTRASQDLGGSAENRAGATPVIRERIDLVLDETRHLRSIDWERVEQLIEDLLAADKIAVLGAGRSGLALRMFTMRLRHLGLEAYVAGETTSPHLEDGDLLIVASGKGSTGSINCVAQRISNSGATTWALTGNETSSLSAIADRTLLLPSREQGKSAQFGGSLFEACVILVGDTVFGELAARMGQGFPEIATRHTNLE